MEDDLHCSLCFEAFEVTGRREPRIIPSCGHTFCFSCIGQLPRHQCPVDRKPFTCLLSSMPKNHLVVSLLERQQTPTIQRPQLPATIEDLESMKMATEYRIEQRQREIENELTMEQRDIVLRIAIHRNRIREWQQNITDTEALLHLHEERLKEVETRLQITQEQLHHDEEELKDIESRLYALKGESKKESVASGNHSSSIARILTTRSIVTVTIITALILYSYYTASEDKKETSSSSSSSPSPPPPPPSKPFYTWEWKWKYQWKL